MANHIVVWIQGYAIACLLAGSKSLVTTTFAIPGQFALLAARIHPIGLGLFADCMMIGGTLGVCPRPTCLKYKEKTDIIK
jgi:hypothetical protein